ncbi:NAD(P)-dependent oxidoreductase [Piscinibacter sakaiensis]|uniref:Rrf2-linked NADH-flavin reductase n=1 Tax=Piscinibacter sakaiensis TaxID=1547922 RepID=A0A0K8PA20_PISS1|nr:NAD(P)-dependent oxidoreductase [Piscinibacter sakaiensis]GAP39005.1 Rrf2-linked NADH-flavin reductase [Piscinibacter sakaiensis]
MNLVLIGASGYVGSGLLQEALARGHAVRALVRDAAKLAPAPGLVVQSLDVFDTAALTAALRGADAVLTAFSGHAHGDVRADYLRGLRSILAAVKAAGVPRLLVVGGAGSLEVAPGVQLVDTPAFPAEWLGTALGARDALALLRDEPALDWTMLSPSALLVPGERTGRFRLGGDQLLVGADGESRISVADYAVAMLDELERPAHPRRRFTVGY